MNSLGFKEEAQLLEVARVVILNSILEHNYYVYEYPYCSEIIAAKTSTNNNARPHGAKRRAQRVWRSCTDAESTARQQPCFDSSMQYCIRSLIFTTNAEKYCERAKSLCLNAALTFQNDMGWE